MRGTITYRWPLSLIAVFNIIGYLFLFFSSNSYNWMTLVVGGAATLIICSACLVIIKKDYGDEYLVLTVSMLLSVGLMMIYRLDDSLGLKQLVWITLGLAMFFAFYHIYIKVDKWDKFAYIYISLSAVLYLVTLILGRNINGAVNWIVIGGFSFQPSELCKILFVFFLAAYFKNPDNLFLTKYIQDERLRELLNKGLLMLVAYCNIGFLVLQRELGTALLMYLTFLVVVYVFSKDLKMFLLNSAFIVPGAILGYFKFYHLRVRVDAWLNPWADITGKGYQVAQSLFAIASGGFFGTGIGMGRPEMVPAVSTDFIFSAICEEMGIFGGVAVVLICMLFTYRGIKIVLGLKNRFKKVLALGIVTMIGLQTFIIVGGVIKLIPLTGITLPFVSYGGSSLISSFIALGILQAISNPRFDRVGGESDG
ncbi:MAG TPA: FtsW/RodA/SpoVE family cell cycle protein [Acetivibrio sp.]|uniref:FtsW/RodA/SpoVE family cell cycle protein n=1 Tax=Acetivibrio sp. TaxID=1872092 RepID=UPI002BAC05D2|nr:FtsW/RodA/SpoVE family cell cycle protein [Acetivibrio sp.]HOM02164.1 FtsW/RodA/SpoVE family cell cycle protein [Acetivibrio sp.]